MKIGPIRRTWFDAIHRSGQVISLEAPGSNDSLSTALGRITQDLRDHPETRDAFISLRPDQEYGVSVIMGGTRADFPASSPDERGCACAFVDAIGYIRELLQTDEQRAALDGILINRLNGHRPERALAAQAQLRMNP